MICNQCGIDNQMGAQFCRACATPLLMNQKFNQQYVDGQQHFNHQFHQPKQSASGRAITAMVLSITGILLCGFFTCIPGMILGKMEMTAIDEGRAPIAGSGFAKTGYYAGMVGTGFSLLCGGFYVLYFFASYVR